MRLWRPFLSSRLKPPVAISFSKCFRLQLPKNIILRIRTLVTRPCALKGDAVSPHRSFTLGRKKFGLYSPHFRFCAGMPGALGKLFTSDQSLCEDCLVMLLRSVRPWFICHISAAWATYDTPTPIGTTLTCTLGVFHILGLWFLAQLAHLVQIIQWGELLRVSSALSPCLWYSLNTLL